MTSIEIRKPFRHSDTASDSDGSEEDSVSLASSQHDGTLTGNQTVIGGSTITPKGLSAVPPKKRRSRKSRQQEWDIVEGLKDGQKCLEKPERFQGYLMKRRKWPMKGWHKRFFVLETGILTYAKTGADIQKGKYHGIVDIGLAVIAFKRNEQRMDIDAEEQVHHLKVKDKTMFDEWMSRLRHHRLYRQHEIAYGSIEAPRLFDIKSPTEEIPTLTNANMPELALNQSLKKDIIRQSSFKTGQGRVMAWLLDSTGFEQCGKYLQSCQGELHQLKELLEKIQAFPIAGEGLNTELIKETTNELVRVQQKRQGFRNSASSTSSSSSATSSKRHSRKSDSYTGTSLLKEHLQGGQSSTPNGQTTPTPTSTPFLHTPNPSDRLHTSASNPNLLSHSGNNTSTSNSSNNNNNGNNSNEIEYRHSSNNIGATPLPSILSGSDNGRAGSSPHHHPHLLHSITIDDTHPGLTFLNHESRIQDIQRREKFITKAEQIHGRLKEMLTLMATERDRLRKSVEQDNSGEATVGQIAVMKHALLESQKQNADLRSRLARIHADSTPPESLALPILSPAPPLRMTHEKGDLAQSLSLDSFSMSEYYDAEENIGTISDSSESEHSDDDASSEISEDGNETDVNTGVSVSEVTCAQSICATGRRSKLPVPKPESPDVSMWNLLYRNIGKDLTKISMPVTLNEPLSMLQRLCEELEYSELLDKAAEYNDPYERMIYIAAFAVSSYASSYYREGHKPFNPLLGETYEAIREDKGWRFIAEQVSHHPPISACYCESRNFTFWQDVRMKTKFWGKSMEIQPLGHVHVLLPKYREHYKWNKVTTCVHNLLGGQRWADQYGEMTITNNNIVCKLTFTKGANHYSSKRYEVFGNISNADGKVVHNLFGKWNEAFFCGHASSAKCIWRPGAMPEDYELYYGFTRFAIELNGLDPDMSKFLPPTDSRFRPDQRLLEEGKIQEAETEKHRLENSQRDRRKKREAEKLEEQQAMWFRKTTSNGKESYEYTNKYWEHRKDPGFCRMSFMPLY